MTRQAIGLQFQLIAQPASRFDGAKRQRIVGIWLERRAIRNCLWPRFVSHLPESESGEYEKRADTYGESHFCPCSQVTRDTGSKVKERYSGTACCFMYSPTSSGGGCI